MKAVVTRNVGTGRTWRWEEVADPVPGPEDVVIRVAAAGLNHADLLMRTGEYVPSDASWRVSLQRVGFECAGTVIATGTAVASMTVGDRVMTQAGGACAEMVVVDARLVLPLRGVGENVAAALPSGLLTEYDALDQAGFEPGDDVLVTGASSGVGRIGVQLAKALGARTVIATTRTRGRVADLQALGADLVIHTETQTIGKALADAGHPSFQVALDHVGGPLLAQVVEAARPRARIMQIGQLAPDHATIDLQRLSVARLTIIGTTFRGRDLHQLRSLAAKVRDDARLADRWANITPSIDRVCGLDQPEHAARRLMQGRGGKVVLQADRGPLSSARALLIRWVAR